MSTQVLSASAPNAIATAVDLLQRGGIVAIPTDTVYGIGALLTDAAAIERLYAVKGREHTKSIAVLLAGVEQLPQVAQGASPAALRLAARFWPGALTLVVPRLPSLPSALSQTDTVGVRVPNHPLALQLLTASGPLAVTSANLSGQPDALTAQDVLAQLEGRIDLVLDGGPTPGAVPSTVVDTIASPPRMLRAGPISESEILAASQAG
ncbi:MAG: threonylcarbamoyl-AMP synthase [Anaerolineales bacterium]|nr:MAG: threonylcarbamoyl-AMP synthase [Anaerolineales bacterium]